MTHNGELTEEEFTEYLKDFMARESEFFKLIKEVLVFKCPECGFTDEIVFSFTAKFQESGVIDVSNNTKYGR